MAPRPAPAEVLSNGLFWSSKKLLVKVKLKTASVFFLTKTASVVVEAPNKTCLQPSPPIQLIQEKQNEAVLPNIFQNNFSFTREARVVVVFGETTTLPALPNRLINKAWRLNRQATCPFGNHQVC
jgi:hypothetical protein